MKKKRVHLTAISLILSLITLVSCSFTFDAGVSGNVYEKNNTTPYSGAYVYAYTSESERDSDYNRWFNIQKGEAYGGLDGDGYPVKDTAPFTPNPNYNVFSTQTDADGAFTVSKIVWNTSSPIWGKDNDRTKLYMMYYSPDATLLKDNQVYSIVSGSTNQAKIRANLKKCFITFPGISSYIRDKSSKEPDEDIKNSEYGRILDDGRKIALYVHDGNAVGNEWREIQLKQQTRSVSKDPTQGDTYITHGNFTNLGKNARLKLIYDPNNDYGYIKYYIRDVSDNITTGGVKADWYNNRRYTQAFEYTSDATTGMPEIDRSKDSGTYGMYNSEPILQ